MAAAVTMAAFLALIGPANALGSRFCSLEDVPIGIYRHDTDTGTFKFLRHLDPGETLPTVQTDAWFASRLCNCFEPEYEPVYCPVEINGCYTPSRWKGYGGDMPYCKRLQTKSENIFQFMFLLIMFWLCCVMLFLLPCTDPGNHCIGHVISSAFPSFNHWIVQRMWRRRPERVYRVLRPYGPRLPRRGWFRRPERDVAQEAAIRAVLDADRAFGLQSMIREKRSLELALRTRTYRRFERTSICECAEKETSSSDERIKIEYISQTEDSTDEEKEASSSNADGDDDHTCTICLTKLRDGDRVGDLPCCHSFHVECLKVWLPQRNVCPLCQSTAAKSNLNLSQELTV